MGMNTEKIVWIDVETTGLNPRADALLEVACVVTDNHLTALGFGTWVLGFPKEHDYAIDPFVVEMHDVNGLWKECERAELTAKDVDLEVMKLLDRFEAHAAP